MKITQSIFLAASQCDRIRTAIAKSGLSQAEVARRAGLRPQNLCNILSGKRQISEDSLRQVCRQVGLTATAQITVTIGRARS